MHCENVVYFLDGHCSERKMSAFLLLFRMLSSLKSDLFSSGSSKFPLISTDYCISKSIIDQPSLKLSHGIIPLGIVFLFFFSLSFFFFNKYKFKYTILDYFVFLPFRNKVSICFVASYLSVLP